MAKLIFTAAALFLLFAFSHARTPSDLPNGLNDAKIDDNQIPVTDANPTKPLTKTLLLPSERPGSETKTVVELEPEVFVEEQKLPEAAEFATIEVNDEDTADASKSETVPLTVISFRPVGRHFPRRPFPLTSRHGRPCGHGHRQWSRRFHWQGEREKDTHFGDDMILSSGDEIKFEHPSGGVVRQIPARGVNFRHGPRLFPFKLDDEIESERPRHHHHHRHHEHEQEFEAQKDGEEIHRHEHEHEHEHRHEHGHGHGLFRNIRKFLNRF